MITAERLRELLTYDPETGVFTNRTWRRGSATARVGCEAGWLNPNGYRYVELDGERYLSSRLAVLYMTGQWPEHEVDHRNGMPADNRWQNLREATHSQNLRNTPKRQGTSSQYKGVHLHKASGKWTAHIRYEGCFHYLGIFANEEDARDAYLKAAHEHHGEFAWSASSPP